MSPSMLIAGLGLMGGSLGLALAEPAPAAESQRWRRIGFDPDPQAAALAVQSGAVDEAFSHLDASWPAVDLIVLAAPVGEIIRLLGELADRHAGAAVVIDLGSTKTEIVQAMGRLPERFAPIGGHPMCGKAVGGIAQAEAGLFRGAAFALCPVPGRENARHAAAQAEKLVQAVGAAALWLDAETHDRWVAATSHLPHLLATALALATPVETAPLAGPGFQSASRLAAGSSTMKVQILHSNRANVLDALARFRQELDQLEGALHAGDWRMLQERLDNGARQHDQIVVRSIE